MENETCKTTETTMMAGLSKFCQTFKNGETVYLEDSVLWYCLDMGIIWYLSLSIHEKINFKQSYFDMS